MTESFWGILTEMMNLFLPIVESQLGLQIDARLGFKIRTPGNHQIFK